MTNRYALRLVCILFIAVLVLASDGSGAESTYTRKQLNALTYKELSKLVVSAAHRDDWKTVAELRKLSGALTANTDKECALYAACFCDDVKLARKLIEQGVSVNAIAPRQGTVLCGAVRGNSLKCIKLLIDNGANINLYGKYGESENTSDRDFTPLETACREGYVEAVKFLLDRKAKIDVNSSAGALHWACANTEAAAHWQARKSGIGNQNVIKLLVARGADVNRSDRFGKTPLVFAIGTRGVDTVHVLLKKIDGVEINGQFGSSKWTALHSAANGKSLLFTRMDRAEKDRRDVAIIKFLLSVGADPRLKDAAGRRPVDYAENSQVKAMLRGAELRLNRKK